MDDLTPNCFTRLETRSIAGPKAMAMSLGVLPLWYVIGVRPLKSEATLLSSAFGTRRKAPGRPNLNMKRQIQKEHYREVWLNSCGATSLDHQVRPGPLQNQPS